VSCGKNGSDPLLWPSEARTVIKHQAYRRYLNCWMPKVLQKFPAGVVIDGFAGPGVYSDGRVGSTGVIANTFLEHDAKTAFSKLHIFALEERFDRRDHLEEQMARVPAHPRLHIHVQPAGSFQNHVDDIARAAAAAAGPGAPAVWIIDPFGYDLPLEVVGRVLSKPRSEVIITYMLDELARLGGGRRAASFQHWFGDDTTWQDAFVHDDWAARKRVLVESYGNLLRRRYGVEVRSFGIATRGETPRYTLTFATHHLKGLECWNPVAWAADPVYGQVRHERDAEQGDLFVDAADLSGLTAALTSLAGTAADWQTLEAVAARQGHTVAHLRRALTDLADRALAVREEPDKARSPWPTGCRVRFF
jgi:three-Cys-motif partner protein